MPTDTQIRGSLSVSRHILSGGTADIKGNTRIAGNLKVDGWLDAPNIKAPCRGLFADYPALVSAYPHPQPGQWALVGSTIPAKIYVCEGHRWTDTGQYGGNISVDLSYYDRLIADLRDSTIRNADNIAALAAGDEIDTTVSPGTSINPGTGGGNGDNSQVIVTDHPVEVRETSAADLIIATESGEAIATFSGGHIRTANFDSANIQASSPSQTETPSQAVGTTVNVVNVIGAELPLDGLKLSIIGDSISTYRGYVTPGYGVTYPYDDINDVSKTWWHTAAEALGLTVLRNCSWSGSTVTGDSSNSSSAYCGCSDRRIADLADGDTTPDIIIIFMGINDWGNNKPAGSFTNHSTVPTGNITTFSEAYAAAVTKAQTRYPSARVYCCTLFDVQTTTYSGIPTTYPRVNTNGATVTDYNDKILEVCRITGATPIDIHACGINHRTQHLYLFDSLHPNAAGAALIASQVIKALQYS